MHINAYYTVAFGATQPSLKNQHEEHKYYIYLGHLRYCECIYVRKRQLYKLSLHLFLLFISLDICKILIQIQFSSKIKFKHLWSLQLQYNLIHHFIFSHKIFHHFHHFYSRRNSMQRQHSLDCNRCLSFWYLWL